MISIRRTRGFTIVELVVVIAVIGILATITVVAYRGIQQRAQNVAILAAVDQWEKAILLQSMATPGSISVPSSLVCLSTDADMATKNGFATGVCLTANGSPAASYSDSFFSGWDMSDIPKGDIPIATAQHQGVTYRSRGIAAVGRSFSSLSNDLSLIWVPAIKGECGRGRSFLMGSTYSDLCELIVSVK